MNRLFSFYLFFDHQNSGCCPPVARLFPAKKCERKRKLVCSYIVLQITDSFVVVLPNRSATPRFSCIALPRSLFSPILVKSRVLLLETSQHTGFACFNWEKTNIVLQITESV